MIFDQICVMANMYSDAEEWQNYILPEIRAVLEEYQDVIALESIGFSENWEEILSAENE